MVNICSVIDVVLAQSDHINFIKEIADANTTHLGFVQRGKVEDSIKNKMLYVVMSGKKVSGFVMFRHRKIDNQTTLYSICVREELRGRGFGRALFEHLIKECHSLNRSFLQLKCPKDLLSNKFYEKMNCSLHGTEKGKKRSVNVWRYYFSQPQRNLFEKIEND